MTEKLKVGRVEHPDWGWVVRTGEFSRAYCQTSEDAHLFAAARMLREALEGCLEFIRMSDQRNSTDGKRLRNAIPAALAAARVPDGED